uniref:Uncharacterized protein n=1 Tax=Arundo donax TaxID=35708 RepID=A0A0A9H1T9_ARUDO
MCKLFQRAFLKLNLGHHKLFVSEQEENIN